MQWTTDAPHIPGWHWWRDGNRSMRLFHLIRGAFGIMLWYRESEWVPIPDYGEWLGPIGEPEEQP